MGGQRNVWDTFQAQEQAKYTPVYMTNPDGSMALDKRGQPVVNGGATAATYNQAPTIKAPLQPTANPEETAKKRDQFIKEANAILADPTASPQAKQEARSLAGAAILSDLNARIPGFIDYGSTPFVQPPKFMGSQLNDGDKELFAYSSALTDLNPTLRGAGPAGLKNGAEISKDADRIKEAAKQFSDLGIRIDDNRSAYQVTEEQKAMMGILNKNMQGINLYSDEMQKAKGGALKNPQHNDFAKTFDTKPAIDEAANQSSSVMGMPKQDTASKFQDSFTSGAFNRFAGAAALMVGAVVAAPYISAAMSPTAASTAGAASTTAGGGLAVSGGGAPISGALATGGSAVGTTGGAGLGLSSGAGAALGGTAGGGAIASGAGLTGGTALGMGGAALGGTALASGLSSAAPAAGSSLAPAAPAATSPWYTNPNIIGAGVSAAGGIGAALIQNESNEDAQNVQREMSTNAIQAAERANAEAQRITEQNRVRSVGAIEGYNADARNTLSAGYADISGLYGQQQATQRGMIDQGVAGARNDLTQGYGQAENAMTSGTQDARTALMGSSAQAQNTLGSSYDRARSDLQAGYGGAENAIRSGYNTADQRLTESRDNQLGTLGNMYNTSVNRLNPYMQTGTDALGNIKTGVDLGDAAYKFRLKDQTDQINAKLAAQGLSGSGRAASILGEQTARLTADEARRQFENNMQLANLGYGATTQANQLSQGYGRDAAGVFDVTGRSMAANAIGQGQNLSDIGMRRTDQGNTLGLSYSGSIADLQAGTGRDVANLSTQDSARLADLYAKRGGDLAQNTQYGLQMGLQNEQLYGDKLAAAKSDVYGGTANLYSRTGSDIANINTGAAAQGVQSNLTMGSNIAGTYRDQGSNLANLYGAQGANWANALGTAANGYNEYQNRQANQKRFDDYVALQDKWAKLYGRPVS